MARVPVSAAELLDLIPPSALEHFNHLALRLVASVRPRTEKRIRESSWQPRVVPEIVIDQSSIVGAPIAERVDPLSMIIDRVDWGSPPIFLEGAEYKTLVALAEKIASLKPLRRTLLADRVKVEILNWIDRVRAQSTNQHFVQWLIEEIFHDIRERHCLVPLAYVHAESPLHFAGVTIIPFDIDEYVRLKKSLEGVIEANDDEALDKKLSTIKGIARRGWAAVSIKVTADSTAAKRVAAARADEVCSLLRVFWPGNAVVGSRCYARPVGIESLSRNLVIELSGHQTNVAQHPLEPPPEPMVFSDKRVAELRTDTPFNQASSLLSNARSAFQDKLLAALLTYSRNSLSVGVVDRLVLILVALEQMLLRDQSESIQASLGHRLSILVAHTAEERAKIIKAVRDCYDIRSRYIHHGELVAKESDAVLIVLRSAWEFFLRCLRYSDRFGSVEEFHRRLEETRLSAPVFRWN